VCYSNGNAFRYENKDVIRVRNVLPSLMKVSVLRKSSIHPMVSDHSFCRKQLKRHLPESPEIRVEPAARKVVCEQTVTYIISDENWYYYYYYYYHYHHHHHSNSLYTFPHSMDYNMNHRLFFLFFNSLYSLISSVL
jgi:hypothetical protein